MHLPFSKTNFIHAYCNCVSDFITNIIPPVRHCKSKWSTNLCWWSRWRRRCTKPCRRASPFFDVHPWSRQLSTALCSSRKMMTNSRIYPILFPFSTKLSTKPCHTNSNNRIIDPLSLAFLSRETNWLPPFKRIDCTIDGFPLHYSHAYHVD